MSSKTSSKDVILLLLQLPTVLDRFQSRRHPDVIQCKTSSKDAILLLLQLPTVLDRFQFRGATDMGSGPGRFAQPGQVPQPGLGEPGKHPQLVVSA